jgi:REP element-mobilizing transposase RayT
LHLRFGEITTLRMPARRPSIIAHHLLWTLYGHWLANDPRGSGSEDVRDPKLAPLGDVHLGRKPARLQPSQGELRGFYREARPMLQYAPFWLDEAKRQAVAGAIGEVVCRKLYTVWACAVLSNHVHLVVRRHRDDARTIWRMIADATRLRLREFADVEAEHPVWAARPYAAFLDSPERVRRCVAYVERNPLKEGLAAQQFDFVIPYDGWPFHRWPR